MKLKTVLSLITCCSVFSSAAIAQVTNSTNQQNIMSKQNSLNNERHQVGLVIDHFVEAFRTKNLEMMMSIYAPNFVAFDIVPPLQDVGKEKYREIWKKVFTFFQNPITFETCDRKISASMDVAFSHELLRLQTVMPNGQKVDRWERLTFGFQKINGKWLILHEHVSVPADILAGKALLDLHP